jgi:hypothetical protein
MQKINSETDLRVAILQLETKQAEEGKILKENALLAYESIKPINLIKNTFREAAESKDLKDNILNTTVGVSAGYLSKIIFQGLTNNPVKKLLGTAVMFGITNLVAKNPAVVKSAGKGFFTLVRSLMHEREKRASQKAAK